MTTPTKFPSSYNSNETIVHITAPHFCAGVVVRDDRVIEAAPIVSYMKKKGGWSHARVQLYCAQKHWKTE